MIKNIFKAVRSHRLSKDAAGNALIMGIVSITILSMFGLTMVSRMVLDANSSALRLSSTKAFYLADSAVRLARRRLSLGIASSVAMGPWSLGDGTLELRVWSIYERIGGYSWSYGEDVWKIEGTGTVGNTTRLVEELRYRGGPNDLDFIMWRENIEDQQ